MSTVLYQKYRSQDFDQLKGQDNVTKLLKNAVKKNQLAHAYLFVGSRGTGKTSTARILAKAINCLEPKKDGNPCLECDNCKSIANGTFLDLIEIDAASNRGIDQIRELKERIEFSPTEGRYKVYIIDEVHMLTTEAFNALLKTLEEPPAHVIFILATTDVHKLPPTILSRCQRYDFRLGTDDEIRDLIKGICKEEKITIQDEALDVVVQNAKGSYRDALSLMDVVYSGQEHGKSEITLDEVRKTLGLPDSEKVILLLTSLLDGDGGKALETLEGLEQGGVNLQQFTAYVLDTLRRVLTAKIKGAVEKDFPFMKDIDIKELHKLINLFLDAENKLRYANNQLLVLEMIIPEMMKPNVSTEIKMVNRDVKKKIPVQEEEKKETPLMKQPVEDKEVTLEEINSKWDQFIDEIRPHNHHLYAFIGTAHVISFEQGILHVEVPFSFHKERIEIPKSRNVLAEVFMKVYGVPCVIDCDINPDMRPVEKSDADTVLRNLPTPKPSEKPKKEYKPKEDSSKMKAIEAIFEGV